MSEEFGLATDVDRFPKRPIIDDSASDRFSALLKEHKISDDEYVTLKGILGRAPTLSELGVFSAMWSEHCSYKSSRVHLARFPTEGEQVVVGPGENAGVVRLSGKLCAAFKMESHNHPSFIEPYQGAATGVGGILRDVFCMGARPVANLNALRFGDKAHPKTSWLLSHAVQGIGDYGNCVGIPTVGGSLSFDSCYDGNCLVNAMTVGLIAEDRIFKGFASGVGNLVVYVGSATGRDGIHGATMASDSFESAEESERAAVQVGDPFMEKLLMEATLEVLDKDLVVGIQDMGAAGLTSSSFEMADRAETGLLLDLDKVPQRTKTAMSAYELLLSESQERMLMVIEPSKWEALAAVLERWQLHYAVIGKVTDTGRMQASYGGHVELDVPIAPLATSAPKYNRPIKARPTGEQTQTNQADDAYDADAAKAIKKIGFNDFLQKLLKAEGRNDAVFTQYDRHIGATTRYDSEHGGASVQWIQSELQDPDEPYLGLATAAGCLHRYCRIDPRAGAAHTVAKVARTIAATGATPLAITDCMNYGNPEVPEVMWEFSEGVDGISEACDALNTPVVSGNVSLYNETDGKSIAPTPMIGMVGRLKDVRKAISPELSQGQKIYALIPGGSTPRFGGSLAALVAGLDASGGSIPQLDLEVEKQAMTLLQTAAEDGIIGSCRDIGAGGIAATITKMLPDGAVVKDLLTRESAESFYFGERAASYLIGLSAGRRGSIF